MTSVEGKTLVERLRERAESYRLGGPSSEHTAALLDEAAEALLREAASALSGQGFSPSVDESAATRVPQPALPDTPRPAGWRDISTAPKDGTPILAWCVHPHARWASDDKEWCAPVVTQWITFNGGGWTWHGMAGRFTHWMPLPPPPAENGPSGATAKPSIPLTVQDEPNLPFPVGQAPDGGDSDVG